MPRVMVVEDEESLLQTLRYNLAKAGYDVRLCTDGAQALELARADPPDAMVLDVMLPGLDGLDVCRMLRRESNSPAGRVPILMLTARDEEIDRVLGLEIGADDYLTKPFSMRELLARVKSLLRRREMDRAAEPVVPTRLESGNLVVDEGAHVATVDGQALKLKPREFELLAYFLRHQGLVLTRDTLLERVWGYDFVGDTRTVDVHVRWLRSKIEADPANPERIQTVRGVGYLFAG